MFASSTFYILWSFGFSSIFEVFSTDSSEVITTLNDLQHCLSFLVKSLGDYRFTVLQLLSLMKWSFIQISIIHDNISSQVSEQEKIGFGRLINSSIVHANICSLICKKCHPNSYHSDIIYHMTLIIVFSVVPHCHVAYGNGVVRVILVAFMKRTYGYIMDWSGS